MDLDAEDEYLEGLDKLIVNDEDEVLHRDQIKICYSKIDEMMPLNITPIE